MDGRQTTSPNKTPRMTLGEASAQFAGVVSTLLEASVIEVEGSAISAAQLISALEGCSVPIYLAGGTVRDLLLQEVPNDIDMIGMAPLTTMADVVRRTFGPGVISIINEPLSLIRIGNADTYFDLNSFRDIESVDGARSLAEVHWRYSGSPASDALTTDFTMNAMYWHPDVGLVDPLGGFDHCLGRRLVISADPRKAAIDPKLALRLARFAGMGFEPSASALNHFRARINADIRRYGPLLPSYLHELTRGSAEAKLGIVDFCARHGAEPDCVQLLAQAADEFISVLTPYALSRTASPLPL